MRNYIRQGIYLFKAVAAVVLCAGTANGAAVTENEVRTASAAFLSSDAVGRAVLKGRSVSDVSKRGGLWIVRLSPSGHIVMSGSDLVDPIVAFSVKDYVEPEDDSAVRVFLGDAEDSTRIFEESGENTGRHERWTKLLAARPSGRRLKSSAVEVQDDAVIIEPFLTAKWSQSQPFNDYMPVYDANVPDTSDEGKRGRCPCGCVATAASQFFHYFKWPARIDGVYSCTHDFIDANGKENSFPVRFDGHMPIEWDLLNDEYTRYHEITNYEYYATGGYRWWTERKFDLRGIVPEATRHLVSRLLLWTDVMAEMAYSPANSSASYSTVSDNVRNWYTVGQWVDLQEGADLVRDSLAAGFPCQISIWQENGGVYDGGHQVVVHGWAEDAGCKYAYLNFGAAGTHDGYYNIAEDFEGYNVKRVYVGHHPRAKPQLDPLPAVCDTNITVRWHFPDIYTNKLEGFELSLSGSLSHAASFMCDFSDPIGTFEPSRDSRYLPENAGICVTNDPTYGVGRGNLLYADSFADGTYTFPKTYILTGSSVLTFMFRSVYALSYARYEIQASFNDGEWETVIAPELARDLSAYWHRERVYLGGHAGERARFRVFVEYDFENNSYYPGYTRVLLDDFQVTDVIGFESIELPMSFVGKNDRSLELSGLTEGAVYNISVTPIMSDAIVECETSDVLTASIAGESVVPSSGVETSCNTNLVFSAYDLGGVWSYEGAAAEAVIANQWWCGVTADIQEPFAITEDTVLSFDWSVPENEFYGEYEGKEGFDEILVQFLDYSYGDYTFQKAWTNRTAMSSPSHMAVPLSSLAGRCGRLTVICRHSFGFGSDVKLINPALNNLHVSAVPDTLWSIDTKTALGTPQILQVSVNGEEISEGMYHECGFDATEFLVICSDSVVSLSAKPSHLSLVDDDHVSVENIGDGKFRVLVFGTNLSAGQSRSRIILTLAASDANGTTAYKDISLRFSEDVQGVPNIGYISSRVDGYDGEYDREGHGISVTLIYPRDALVKYATSPDGPYGEANILFTNVTDGAETVWCTIEAPGCDTVTNTATVRISPKAITADMVWMQDGSIVYDGAAKEPKVMVAESATHVLPETEYDVAYSNNVNAGVAYVIVRGKGNHMGEVMTTFTIRPRDIAQASLSGLTFVYDAGDRIPLSCLVDDLGHAIDPADYSLSWSLEQETSAMELTFAGRGNYEGSLKVSFAKTRFGVSFDANGGEGEMPAMVYDYGVEAPILSNEFTKVGHSFAGWATEQDGEILYPDGETIKFGVDDLDKTFYAVWTANTYTISFDFSGGVDSNGNARVEYDLQYGTDIAPYLPVPEWVGHTFSSWTPDVAETVPAGDVEYVAEWRLNTCEVTFDANSGVGTMPEQIFMYGEEQALAVNSFTRVGYTFAGWATEAGGSVSYTDGQVISTTEAVTLYAAWKKYGCHVTFDANGGSTSEPLRAVKKNAKIGTLPSATRKGYKLNGWYTKTSGGTKISTTTKITKDVKYYAQWAANKYTIKFNANGGSGSMKDISTAYGKSVTLTANAFKRTNWTFLGWSTSKNAAEKTYANKQKVKNLTATANKTVTLYAVWKRNTYTVNFEQNGGAGDPMTQIVNCGDKTALTKNSYKREGFTFAGWATTADGSVKYKNKVKVTDLAKNGKSITLYAVWKPAAWAVGTFEGAGHYLVDAWGEYESYDFVHTATVGSYCKLSGSVTVDVKVGKQEKASFSAPSSAMQYLPQVHIECWHGWDPEMGWVNVRAYDGPAYYYDVDLKLHGVTKSRRIYICDMIGGTLTGEDGLIPGLSCTLFEHFDQSGESLEMFEARGSANIWKSKAYKGTLPKFSSSSMTKKVTTNDGDVCTFTLKQDGSALVKIARSNGKTDSASFTMDVKPLDDGKSFRVDGVWIFPKGCISSVTFKMTPNSKGVIAEKNIKVLGIDVE